MNLIPQSQHTSLHREAGSQHNDPQNGTQSPVINDGATNANTYGHTNGNNNKVHNRNIGQERVDIGTDPHQMTQLMTTTVGLPRQGPKTMVTIDSIR
ncbi:hypothetical protein TSUD_160510 [Trifolium subterraneum]|uniref:Uncharacterized protein n=1 Tax=Trifolium subterraneum TaxID=3900 RepID=A0A2Z6NG75_TRISU|nr:hypothetical protein TSUD_160510 [Trifolium subterraneum]